MKHLLFYLCGLLSSSIYAISLDPFLALPETTGSMVVRLYPTENVQTDTEILVTFGIPFTRGSLTESDLSTVRVFNGIQEVPAYVGQLTPWRHLTSEVLDGSSVRIARVQIKHTFSVEYPNFEEITVDWGSAARTASISSFTDPKTAWHLVESGSFDSSDDIYEPDVYAVLPKEVLTKGVLKLTRMAPFAYDVTEEREDPYAIKAIQNWLGYEKLDHIFHNQLFTHVNEDDPAVTEENKCKYKTAFEPWLYDRASTMYVHYFRSGFLKPLREAVRASQFYRSQLYPPGTEPAAAIGIFKLKIPNPYNYIGGNGAMYSYNQCLAYTYWLTGDDSMIDPIKWVTQAQEIHCEPTRWSPQLSTWTERHTAFRLLANSIAYEVTGELNYKINLKSQSEDFIWHQNGANGQAPTDGVDGGLYHYGIQHGDGVADNFIASPWMSVLTLDAMLRVYGLGQKFAVADFIRRLGSFLQASCKSDIYHYFEPAAGIPLPYPDYVTTYDGTTDSISGRESAAEHSLEVAAGLAWAWYFSELLNQSDSTLKNLASQLYDTYGFGSDNWLRPSGPDLGKPAYRIAPWRKYSWEHLPAGNFAWVMEQNGVDVEPALPVAVAGPDQTVVNDSLVTLDGTRSYDPNGDAISYSWQQTSGQTVSLSNPNVPDPSFTVPPNANLSFDLTVTANGQSAQDSIKITSVSQEKALLFFEPSHAWLFEEQQGDIVIDSIDSNFNGTFDTTPANPNRTTGIVGNALSFDGLNDRVKVPSGLNIVRDAFTVSLWMYLNSQTTYGCLISKSNNSYRPIFRLEINNNSLGLDAYLTTGSQVNPYSASSGPNSFTLNTWHHVAVIYDNSSLRILVDGTQVATTVVTGYVSHSSIAAVAIGNRPTTSDGNNPIDGILDQVRIYDRALTTEEISILLNETAEPDSPNISFTSWLTSYDPSLTGDDALPDADPNQNGVSNLLEYAFDVSSPDAGVDQFLPKVGTYDDGIDQWLTLKWRQINEASDLAYNVEYSYNLVEWFPINDGKIDFTQTVLDSNPDGDSSATLNQIQLKETTDGSLFLRVNVEQLND